VVAGLALSASAVVNLDVAIRAGQFAVAPLFAFYPTVLPRAASLVTRGGNAALRSFLQPYYSIGAVVVVIGISVLAPLEVPALATWTGRSTGSFNPLVAAGVLVGTSAHASTGLLSSALLARGDVRSVLTYKARQMLLAIVLLSITAPLGLVPMGLALCVSLALPALCFNATAARQLELASPLPGRSARRRLTAFALIQVSVPMTLVLALRGAVAPWQLLGLAVLAAVVCAVLVGVAIRGCNGGDLGYSPEPAATSSAPAIADHFAKK
jgi:hypothetical protein